MLSYGPDPMQTLDFWPSAAVDPELVVFVHGGGWSGGDNRMMQGSDKLRHWQGEVYAVASLNYRLVPEATVEQEAEDVAAAIALLKTQADVWGFDPERIALVGHSAGAHLVALVGTDERYLRSASVRRLLGSTKRKSLRVFTPSMRRAIDCMNSISGGRTRS